jgi:uncharacterized protein (DUF2141 family)
MAAALLAGASAPVDLVVEVRGLRNQRGTVHVCLTRDPAHFPDCQGDAGSVRRSIPAARAGRITLPGVAAGDYALALVHDENGNGRLDTLVAIPREGFGFSRNPRIRFGAPRFRDARFTVEGGRTTLIVNVRYLL